MLFTILTTSLILSLVFMFAVYIKNRRASQQVLASLAETDTRLKRHNEKEHELQEEIGSLQARLELLLEDPVTRLPMWALFADRVTQVIHECERYHLIMGVLYVDINDFKTVNSALGPELSDKVLSEIASRLQVCVRQVDLMTRQSKDVFVIMLARLSKPETAVVVAQRILQELALPFNVGTHELSITSNIGLALYPTDGVNAETLMRCAEQALQLAKSKGKQGFQFYHGELQQQAERELAIYSSMGRDTLFRELKLYFQPIVNAQDKSVFCIDTILEWHHPEVGVLSMAEVLVYAEKQGKLLVVSEWMVSNAIKQFVSWREKGFMPKMLAIPLEIKALEGGHFVPRLGQIMKEHDFDPRMLLLEIPENFYHASFEIVEKAFNMLEYLGVKVALNHFGAGSLALRYLKGFSFNYFKLDRMLIEDITENERTRQLIGSLINLANSLSVLVIAEGVETEEQVETLKELGCLLVEGNLLGVPVVQDKMVEVFST